MSFPLSPPPPAFTRAGSLPEVAAAFAAHVAAEDRRAWVAPSSALRLDERGRLAASQYPPATLEECGLRGLLVYYNDRFPRATPVFSLLSAPTAAMVFDELFDAGDTRLVKVCERRGAVYAVTSPSYATEYDVADVVRDVAAIFGGAPVPCALTYASDTLDVALLLELADFDIRIDATDRYGEEVVRVRVLGKDGTDHGDPAPTVRKRKSAANGSIAGATIAEGVATKIAASADFFSHATRRAKGAS